MGSYIRSVRHCPRQTPKRQATGSNPAGGAKNDRCKPFFDGLQRFFVIVFRERFCRSAGTILYIFRCMPANWLRTIFPALLIKNADLLIRFSRPIFGMGPTPEKWSAYSVFPQYDGRCFRRARCRRRQRPWSRVHRRPLHTTV